MCKASECSFVKASGQMFILVSHLKCPVRPVLVYFVNDSKPEELNIRFPPFLMRNTNISCLGQTALMIESTMLDILIKYGGIFISCGWPLGIFSLLLGWTIPLECLVYGIYAKVRRQMNTTLSHILPWWLQNSNQKNKLLHLIRPSPVTREDTKSRKNSTVPLGVLMMR